MAQVSSGVPSPSSRRRTSAFLFRHPRLKLTGLLGAPLAWFLVAYLGALVLLFATAFWHLDPFTGEVVKRFGFQNFQQLWNDDVYRAITLRTLGIAAAVALTDVVIGFPIAYYAARLASPRMRNAVLIAVVLPLWANYLVRVFAWRLILSSGGFVSWLFGFVGLDLDVGYSNWAVWITFTYLWLPFTLLPIYGSLERVPGSLLEASSDLGGRGWLTFRRVVFPLTIPGIVAGSIFAFSLTLGDYIAPTLVGNTRFIGNVIYDSVGVANNVPFAAAFALVPVAIMALYLLGAWRLGAFEAI
jgi:putative spermidine/putrescine transport system permease protein